MKITTLNANGLRSSYRKGLEQFLQYNAPDIFCIQETRMASSVIPDSYHFGYQTYFHQAQKAGYSGVAVYTKNEPQDVITDFDQGEFDQEGRCIGLEFDRFVVFSVYFPSGSSGEVRQKAKFRFLNSFSCFLDQIQKKKKELIFCGDWNIAHHKIDLKNWSANQKNSGFLPEEREWLTHLLSEKHLVDVFRLLYPDEAGYTWWSNRGKAREKNVGWRIDYQITTKALALHARKAQVITDFYLSDHAPLCVEYDSDFLSWV